MKKIFSVILAAVMLLSAAPLGGFVGLDLFGTTASAASYNGTCGDNLTWTLDTDTGELVISGEGKVMDFQSSSDVPWWSFRSQINSITFNNNVTSIGESAFFDCTNLASVAIPKSVSNIREHAFLGCDVLKDVYYTGSKIQWSNIRISTGNSCLLNATIHYINFPCDHDFEAVPAKAPTCTEDGRTEGFMCKKCGVSGTTDGLVKVSKLGHDWVEGTPVPITCTTDGYTPYSCSRCTETKRENVVKAPDHKYEVNDSKEATCLETGYKKYVCTVCGDNYTEEIPKKSHNYKVVVYPPTCEKVGYEDYTCTMCGDTYTDTIPTKKHSYVLTDIVPPTCVELGSETYTCTMCGDSYSYTIPTVNHDYVTTVVAPTCTMIGYTEHKCSVCESYFNTDIVPATGHDMGEWVVLQKGSCTMFELRGRTCLICKTKEFDYIEAPGHDYEKTSIYPTCTEGGYIAHVCSLCGDSYRDSEKPAIGHDFGRWVVLQNGSCTEDEIRERTCSHCKSKEINVIAATDHDYKETKTAATCTEEGKTTFTCSKCNDSYETDFVEPLGHLNFEDREVPATCTESGLTKGRHCARCNEVFAEQEVIPATGHRDGNNDGYCDSCNFETDKVLHCSCRCHKTDFFSKIIWFFEKLFGAKNRPCECGASHR